MTALTGRVALRMPALAAGLILAALAALSAEVVLGRTPSAGIALTVLAMMPNAADFDFRILATDIDPKILGLARAGAYDEASLDTISPAMRKQWFQEVNVQGRRKFQIDDRVKRLITFNELNLLGQWPFKGMFDVIFCRNVVIYFDEPTQTKIWARFAGQLQDAGHLYIGHSERVSGEAKHLFDNIGITTYRYTTKGLGRKA